MWVLFAVVTWCRVWLLTKISVHLASACQFIPLFLSFPLANPLPTLSLPSSSVPSLLPLSLPRQLSPYSFPSSSILSLLIRSLSHQSSPCSLSPSLINSCPTLSLPSSLVYSLLPLPLSPLLPVHPPSLSLSLCPSLFLPCSNFLWVKGPLSHSQL